MELQNNTNLRHGFQSRNRETVDNNKITISFKNKFKNISYLGYNYAVLTLACALMGVSECTRYKDNDEIILYMNTVGPYPNHQETYNYFSLPFCRGPKKEITHYHDTLGEAILGVELESSGLDIRFKQDVPETKYCSVFLTEEKYEKFVYAIKNLYSYQMYIDDLPIEGLIGQFMQSKQGSGTRDAYYLFTHKDFSIGFNKDRIVEVNVTMENQPQLLEPNTKIDFYYSIQWSESKGDYLDRFDRYLDPTVFKPRIHWFSIINSFMLVLFLVGLVSMILMRTLRKDYARYSRDDFDDIERDMGDEYGWKQVHSDVFRTPPHPLALSVLVGTGYQIAAVALTVIVLAIVAELYTERGSLLSTTIYSYSLLSIVNGYFGGGLYARLGGRQWIRQMLFATFSFPSLVCGMVFMVNLIALSYHTSRAIPLGTMFFVVCIGLFINLPLTLAGTILGRNLKGHADYPCRVSSVPRPIPYKNWYMEPSVIMLLGGILPFGSISIEMYFIFTSFWTFKIYYVYGFMLLVFLISIAVTVCVNIVCTYILLNAEDYRWQWTSFLTGASTSLYVYLYSFYYFFFKTKMYGLFQTAFYFGHMAIFSLALGIMCGAIGYVGTSLFVKKIYSTVKID